MLNKDDEASKAALSFAAHVARKLKRKLTVFTALPDPANAFVYVGPEAMAGVSADAAARAAEAGKAIRARIDGLVDGFKQDNPGEDQLISVHHHTGLSQRIAYEEAAISDMMIMPAGAPKTDSGMSIAFDSLLMEYGQPVLIAPPVEQGFDTAIIAWDGSPEAARAVRMHAPLLEVYERILVAQNTSDIADHKKGEHTPPEALVEYLREQGASVSVHDFKGKVAAGLIEAVKTKSASLIVSGAYGHSRAGEMLFGGATRGLLHKAPPCALALSH